MGRGRLRSRNVFDSMSFDSRNLVVPQKTK
jgi:hypothetical protein